MGKMKKYLVDTVIFIDHLNEIEKATDWLHNQNWDNLTISVITRAEILTGSNNENYKINSIWNHSLKLLRALKIYFLPVLPAFKGPSLKTKSDTNGIPFFHLFPLIILTPV